MRDNFIDQYIEYAKDDFCPPSFHLWTAITMVSALLERRVWLNEGKIRHFPNLFTLLVGNPGTGKSTAIYRGVSLLKELQKDRAKDFRIMSGQMSQAGLCNEMKILSSMQDGPIPTLYSSGFYVGSEASNSALQNLAGDFNACITELYDCNDSYDKTLKTEKWNIKNPSLSILAGSTFSFLKTLVDETSVMNGLASRFTYVITKDKKQLNTEFGSAPKQLDDKLRKRLMIDMWEIYTLKGTFKWSQNVIDIFQVWMEDFNEKFNKVDSERMQSIMVRKPTLLKKILMILSASERDDLVITDQHMIRAIQLVDEVTKDNSTIITSAMMGNKMTQDAVTQFMLTAFGKKGEKLTQAQLKHKFVRFGGDIGKYEPTIRMMWSANMVEIFEDYVKLLVEPDENF
jgi:hypothetical protein